MATLIKWGLIALAVAGAIAGAVAIYDNWHNDIEQGGVVIGRQEVQGRWDQANLQRADVAMRAGENFRQQERRDAAKATEIENEARKREKAVAAAADGSKSASAGLSGDIAALDAAARGRGLPSAAACPVEYQRQRDSAIFARSLLNQCSQRYQAVAETADGIRLKLDTALGYIAIAVAP